MVPSDSNKHDEIKLNRFTLSFVDDTLEKAFLDYYFDNSLSHIRKAILLGIFLYAIFGIADMESSPNVLHKLWFIRYAIICPSLIFLLIFTFSSVFRKYIYSSLSIFIFSAGIGLVAMMIIDPKDIFYYCMGIILVLFFGYSFARCRFVWATLACIGISIGYEVVEIFVIGSIRSTIINNGFHIAGANILGIFVCYHMEKYERMDFFLKAKLRKRTSELDISNQNLSISIKEQRQQAYEMSVLNDMSNHLNRYGTERYTYAEMSKTCKKLFPDDSGHMYILNNTGTKLEKVAKWGNTLAGPALLDIDDCACFQTGNEHFCSESVHERHCPHQASTVCHGYLCVPIFIRGEKIGALHIGFNPTGSLSDQEWPKKIESRRSLFVRMAEQYAPFLGNLRLRIIDPLTGLRNRIYVSECLESEVTGVERLGIIYFDIDKFRDINEAHGNEAGDILLKRMSAFLKERIRYNDIPCRYGGGEFMIVTPDLTPPEAAYQAEQLRKAIKSELKTTHNGDSFEITVSFGVAGKPDHGETIKEVVAAAEQALRRAKASGKNRIIVI